MMSALGKPGLGWDNTAYAIPVLLRTRPLPSRPQILQTENGDNPKLWSQSYKYMPVIPNTHAALLRIILVNLLLYMLLIIAESIY